MSLSVAHYLDLSIPMVLRTSMFPFSLSVPGKIHSLRRVVRTSAPVTPIMSTMESPCRCYVAASTHLSRGGEHLESSTQKVLVADTLG